MSFGLVLTLSFVVGMCTFVSIHRWVVYSFLDSRDPLLLVLKLRAPPAKSLGNIRRKLLGSSHWCYCRNRTRILSWVCLTGLQRDTYIAHSRQAIEMRRWAWGSLSRDQDTRSTSWLPQRPAYGKQVGQRFSFTRRAALEGTLKETFYDRLAQELEKFDVSILVNNAGYMEAGSLIRIPAKQIHQMVLTNTYPLLLLTKALLPQMKKRNKRSAIINLSSTAAN